MSSLVNDKPMYALYIISSLPSTVGPIDLTCTGKGDSSELVSSLVNDKPMYALYRVTDRVDDITTVKFVFIIW